MFKFLGPKPFLNIVFFKKKESHEKLHRLYLAEACAREHVRMEGLVGRRVDTGLHKAFLA